MTTSLISNPPYNMKWTLPVFAQLQERFQNCELPPESNANYAFILSALPLITDKAAFILPNAVLSADNAQEKAIRRYLIEKNLIEAVILCPDKMFEATDISVCIVLFNKKKITTAISFVDMRKTYDCEEREQKGQFGGASHTNRTYKKTVKVFSEEQMQKAIDCINNQIDIPEFSKTVTLNVIKDNDYILVPSRYIDFEVKEAIHRDYNDIIRDINRIRQEQNALKLTVNEKLAKTLGLYDIFLLNKQAAENTDDINKALSFTGQKIDKESFIAISKKAGELKFENTAKDSVSTILLSILQMWKQHIMYLNNEENIYLAELRDALLPDLMSGKIELSE